MRQLIERCLRGAGAMVLVCAAMACTKSGGDDDDDDDGGHDIRIQLSDGFGGLQNGQLVAIQDGDGSWTSVIGSEGVYLAHITSERFGVVSGCVYDPLDAFVEIQLQTVGDGTTVTLDACNILTDTPVKLSGTISNVPADQFPDVRVKAFTSLTSSSDGYSIELIPGTTDLFASTSGFTSDVAGRVIRKKDLTITSDTTLPLDFASDGLVLDTPALTAAGGVAELSRTSILADGTTYRLRRYLSATTYESLPASLRKAGDVQMVDVDLSESRSSRVIGAEGALTVNVPIAYAAPMPTLLETGYLRPSLVFTIDGGQLSIVQYEADWSTINFDTNNFVGWDVSMTEAYAGDAQSVAFETPDLSGLPGFDPAMGPELHQMIFGDTRRVEATSLDQVAGTRSTTAYSPWTLGEYCGDGAINGDEVCDDAGESPTCTASCTVSSCGDGIVNFSAGEECDPADGITCDDQCHLIVADPGQDLARSVATARKPANLDRTERSLRSGRSRRSAYLRGAGSR